MYTYVDITCRQTDNGIASHYTGSCGRRTDAHAISLVEYAPAVVKHEQTPEGKETEFKAMHGQIKTDQPTRYGDERTRTNAGRTRTKEGRRKKRSIGIEDSRADKYLSRA